MKLQNYSLKVGNKVLFENVNMQFHRNKVNHLLGSNGVGKSCFAKSTIGIMKYKGVVESESKITLISSYTGIPQDLTILSLKKLLIKKFVEKDVNEILDLLNISNINEKIQIKKMSDGQKQKLKLLSFLSSKPDLIILDEFTLALDKSSCIDMYNFINNYVQVNKATVINITHNLSDIEKVEGKYYYIQNKNIINVNSKEELFNLYIN